MWISFANSSIRQINKINGSPSSRWAEPGKKPFDLIMLIEFGWSCGAAQRPKGRTPKSQTKATQRRKKSDAAIITFQTIILFQFCRCFFFVLLVMRYPRAIFLITPALNCNINENYIFLFFIFLFGCRHESLIVAIAWNYRRCSVALVVACRMPQLTHPWKTVSADPDDFRNYFVLYCCMLLRFLVFIFSMLSKMVSTGFNRLHSRIAAVKPT